MGSLACLLREPATSSGLCVCLRVDSSSRIQSPVARNSHFLTSLTRDRSTDTLEAVHRLAPGMSVLESRRESFGALPSHMLKVLITQTSRRRKAGGRVPAGT